MSGPTTTTHDSLVDIWNVKIGRTDPYASGNASAAGLEQKILKAVLGEGATATSIGDFKALASTLADTTIGTHRATDISGSEVQVTQHFPYRNAVVLADYLQNEDTTGNATSSGAVVIKSGTTQSAPSKILNDSSAFENASVKFTVTDPYDVAGSAGDFYSADEVFTGHFAEGDANYRFTRNVNANCANTAGTASISVTEHTTWNTADYGLDGAGPAFVNGSVSLNGEGAPVATVYGSTSIERQRNMLSANYVGTSGLGFDVSYDSSRGEPVVGRYALNWVAGGSSGAAEPITITENNMSADLVVVGDKTEYDAFLADTTATVALTPLPVQGDLFANTLDPYLDETSPTQLPGFRFDISSNLAVTGEVLVTTTAGIVSPISIDASEMAFNLKNKYYLEQSVQTAPGAGQYHTLLQNPTVAGVDVSNCLTITNGSLTLTGTDAAQFEIVDGTESLGATDYNTNGQIEIYPSVPESSYSADHYSWPRSFGGPLGQNNNGWPLENFASTCFVHYSASEYSSSEAGLLADVGVLADADKSIDVAYNITTLANQTTIFNESLYLYGISERTGGAAAFILGEGEAPRNSAIGDWNITFSANTNTYTDGELTVVDIKCQKKWSDNGIVGSDGITAIAGVALDVAATNMYEVGVADIVDLKIVAAAKELTGLSSNMRSSFVGGWSLSLADGNSKLKSSLANQGVISDEKIITILGGNNSTVRDITLNFAPAVASVPAREFTKFHNKLDITYDGQTQTTYDDEFTIIPPAAPAALRVYNSEEVLSPSSYLLPSAVAGKTLVKRSYTETFSVSTPFRFGNYSNLLLTTPTFTQTTTYYVLKDGSRDLPRNLLSTATHANGDPLLAEITTKVGEVNAAPLVAHFVRDDLKPYTATVMKQTTMGGTEVTGSGADLDVWYNTKTEITQTGVGTFTTNVTLSPVVSVMEMETFTVHLTLANGTDTFTFAGKTFSAAQVDALTDKNPHSINLATATGTSLSGTTQYTRGAEGATHTLTGGGYTFTMSNNIYVDIRVYACPNGLFKVVKNGGAPTYKSISNLNSTPYLKLDSGVRVQGALDTADYGYRATWTLTNDAICVNTYNSYGESDYDRILSLNYVYRPYDDWKGVSNKRLRGFDVTQYVTIVRTPSTFVFDIAGYRRTAALYAGLSYQNATIGNLTLSAGVGAITMYQSSSFGASKEFPLSINYGSYTITDTPYADAPKVVTIVPAYKTVISNRKGVRIVSKSLSTQISSYNLYYTTDNTLTVSWNTNYTSTSYDLEDFDEIGSISLGDLQDALHPNYIGNVLNIHYLGESALPSLTCFFTIAPAFLKFQAVDHTTITQSSLPFTKGDLTHLLTRYSAVNHATATTVRQAWNPFSGSNVNNMTISATARSYEDYRGTARPAVAKFNVGPNNLNIQYATGIGGDIASAYLSPAVYDGPIPLNSSSDTNNVSFVSHFASTGGKNEISLNQKAISNSSMPVIFDESDEFNLLVELGSHLLTPKTFTLEFNAGDCTGLTTYCIDSIVKNGANLDVTIAKYTNGSGINSDLFKNNVSNGIAVGGSTKQTKLFYTSLTGNMVNMLAAIKAAIPASISDWVTVGSAGSNSDNVIWLKPTSDTGKTALRTALLLNTNIPRSISVFELDDAVRIMDNQGVAVYRVASQGVVYANTLVDHDAANLAVLSNAHVL